MTDELDKAAEAFTTEIAPKSQPRDIGGKFVQTVGKPQPLFEERDVEGAGDAGEDAGRRSREREVARGPNKRQADVDDVHGSIDAGPERIAAGDEGAEDGELDDDEPAPPPAPRKFPNGGNPPMKTKNTKSSSMGNRPRCP